MTFKNVLIVIDPESESHPGLDKMLSLESAEDFQITLLSCEHTQYLVEGYYFESLDVKRLRKEYIETRRKLLEAIAEPLRENGVSIETDAQWGYPGYETIVRVAGEIKADLVVHNAARHGAVSRMFLTHEDWQLIRLCPVPLLMVKERPWSRSPKLIAALDPMHSRHKPDGLDQKIMHIARAFCDLLKAELFSVHAYHAIPMSGEYPEEAKQAHKAAFQTLNDEFDIAPDHQLLLEASAEFALQQAEQQLDSDVVVMGAISRSLLADVFIGNTTEKVLDYLKSDVLIVKPDGFAVS